MAHARARVNGVRPSNSSAVREAPGGSPAPAEPGWPQKVGACLFSMATRSMSQWRACQKAAQREQHAPPPLSFLADVHPGPKGLVPGAARRTVSRARALPGAPMVTASAVSTTCRSTHPRRASFSSTPSCPHAPTPPHFPSPSSRAAHVLLCVAQAAARAGRARRAHQQHRELGLARSFRPGRARKAPILGAREAAWGRLRPGQLAVHCRRFSAVLSRALRGPQSVEVCLDNLHLRMFSKL